MNDLSEAIWQIFGANCNSIKKLNNRNHKKITIKWAPSQLFLKILFCCCFHPKQKYTVLLSSFLLLSPSLHLYSFSSVFHSLLLKPNPVPPPPPPPVRPLSFPSAASLPTATSSPHPRLPHPSPPLFSPSPPPAPSSSSPPLLLTLPPLIPLLELPESSSPELLPGD